MAATPRKYEQLVSDTFDELVIIRGLVREGRRGWKINDISKSHGRIKVCDLKGIIHKTDAELQVMAIQIQKRAKAYMAEYNAEKRPRLLSEMARPDSAEVESIFGKRPETTIQSLEQMKAEMAVMQRPNLFSAADEINYRLERFERKLDLILSKLA